MNVLRAFEPRCTVRSEAISLLPLSVPGERREDDSAPASSPGTKKGEKFSNSETARKKAAGDIRNNFDAAISHSASRQVEASRRIGYSSIHSSLTLFGGFVGNYLPLSRMTKRKLYKGPLNPSCMVVLEALNSSGALARQQNIQQGGVEEVLKMGDCNSLMVEWEGEEGVEMRPGWRFGRKVVLRDGEVKE